MIGKYCREYRLRHGIKLKDMTDGEQIKTLSAFEMGRSSNIKHLEKYIVLSVKINDSDNFVKGMIEELTNG